MTITLETNDLSKILNLLHENECTNIRFGQSVQELAIKQMVEEYMEDDFDDDVADTIVDSILNHDIFETDIPNTIEEMAREIIEERIAEETERESQTEEWIDWAAEHYQMQFWNWEARRFDEAGNFDWEEHVNDTYRTDREYINDVVNCGDDHYLATIVEGDGANVPHVFDPGYHFVNRLGYVVYKCSEAMQKQFWV